MLAILVLFGCLGLLIAGAWCVSEGGDILGEKYDATIVGGFMIAWLNTAPETIFFITALESGNPNFAVGAISGSVIVVCTIAVGACIYFGGIAHRSQTVSLFLGVRRQAYVLGASLAVIALVLMFGFVAEIGFLGIMAYLGFIAYTLLPKFGGGGPMPDFEGAKGSNWDIEAAEGGAHHPYCVAVVAGRRCSPSRGSGGGSSCMEGFRLLGSWWAAHLYVLGAIHQFGR
eukprot:GEZU01010014.1.p1 GENE.GEZU01010014.1~~GEZU01010014.1.p1  ORF type:complete len:229 (-),score=26.84 GEZU01010014.1:408-1094(-)